MSPVSAYGLSNLSQVHANLATPLLVEAALARREGQLTANGAFAALTGKYTGRSPKDKFLVLEPGSEDGIAWGPVNQPMTADIFERLWDKARTYLQGREIFVFDGFACADPAHRIAVRAIGELAWHALFASSLLIRPNAEETTRFLPKVTILAVPGLKMEPAQDGTRSEACVALALERGQVLVAGTGYAGEIKKSVFTYLNYWMPQRGVLPMHCSANIGPAEDAALFFGLSGTGKTTLSADPERRLIGDDEHGWSDEGVFNFEGGCYAKTIRLSEKGEPLIWQAIRFGACLENVVLDQETRRPDFDDDRYTENTRAAYPIEFIPGAEPSQRGGHPRNVLFLTCDAFGVLPPLARLTPDQARYHFLAGYTAKVAGTERGVTEPQATFSACFAAPFLPLPPMRYARMLVDKITRHNSTVWLVNTGWSGGPFGVGQRIPLAHTRRMVKAILNGELNHVDFEPDRAFGLNAPRHCPEVPQELLQPRATWTDAEAYDAKARQLATLFDDNHRRLEKGEAPASTAG